MNVHEQINASYQRGIEVGGGSVSVAPIEDVLEGLDASWDVQCEMSSHEWRGEGPAEWVMFFSCCPKDGSPYILACTTCKDHKLSYPALYCDVRAGGCGQVFVPGSRAYSRIEPLNKS